MGHLWFPGNISRHDGCHRMGKLKITGNTSSTRFLTCWMQLPVTRPSLTVLTTSGISKNHGTATELTTLSHRQQL